jgi:primosomal protein N' (replication factor Y)
VHGPRQRAVVEYLTQQRRLAPTGSDGLVRTADVLAHTRADHSTITALARKGVIEVVRRPLGRDSGDRVSVGAPTLTAEQASTWRVIEQALAAGDATPILLHGVTGSGKTELYLRAVAWCLRRGKSAIVLVPEIALASQVVRRFAARFGDEVAVLHSDLPDPERYANWQAVARGERRVVVGPRSALFAPVRELGLIVLDEEHEGAYKQESEPRYHARSLAEYLARQQRAVLLLGSATPAVETRWRAEVGQIRRLTLSERPGVPGAVPGVPRSPGLPLVEIVDMRLELHRGRASLISAPLEALLAQTLAAKEQAILLLNRRGMATVVVCRQCGAVVQCPRCDIPLVYHHDRARLLCHRCNLRALPPRDCPDCGGPLSYVGAGTQRVEREVQQIFPNARVLRWDHDSVRRHGGHERLLHKVERREVDIVVGTQMIAKGLDLPLVTAIGVVNADGMLLLPDFRSAERTFQLLTQVAGRAGRRAPGARVIIQTYVPAHYAIQAASRHDYDAFYAEEIDFRRHHGYPPFTRLIRCAYRHDDEERCAVEADEFARQMARHARARGVHIDVLGPTPAFVSRIRGAYQWHFVIRVEPGESERLLDGLPHRPGWTIDIDPQSLL